MVEEAGHDLLERLKELDRRLTSANQRFLDDRALALSVIDVATDAVVVVDDKGKIVLTNHSAETMFGYEISDMIDRHVSIIIPPEYREKHAARQEAYFRNPEPRTFRDFEALRSDGTKFPVSISIFPVESSAGTLVMAVIRERVLSNDDTDT